MKIKEPDCMHGQVFDNRKRWCANCEEVVAPFSGMCHACGAVWPEHVEAYLEQLKEQGGINTDFGVGCTWH